MSTGTTHQSNYCQGQGHRRRLYCACPVVKFCRACDRADYDEAQGV